MAQEFLPNPNQEPNPPLPGETPEIPPGREPLRHILIGSPIGVASTIHNLHVRGYAEANEWSPIQRTGKTGEVISILLRYILRN